VADETPEERRALAELDEATREVAAEELEEVEPRGTGAWGLFRRFRWRRNPDAGDERGLRDALHDGARKE
jgi:hypothetical protein